MLDLASKLARSGNLAAAAQLCSKILQQRPEQPKALYLLATAALGKGRREEASELLGRSVASDPDFAPAWNDLGNLRSMEGKLSEAETCYRRAIASEPQFPEAHNNLGNVLQLAGLYQEAAASYQAALRSRPDYPEAHRNLGSALRMLGQPEQAAQAMRAALVANPSFTAAIHQLVHLSKQICDWAQLDELTAKLVEIVETGSAPVNPFVFLTLDTTPRQQFLCAKAWADAHLGPSAPRPQAGAGKAVITVGYLSADYHDHATVHLIGELFALHDRGRFRVIGYSYGPDDGGEVRRKVAASFDKLVDLSGCSHSESATRIREDAVDILVDLKGYTGAARPEILSLRPAPIQVGYLGYPGTLGTDALDFILVDSHVVPEHEQADFSEHLVYLPDSYQVNDRRRPIAENPPSRSQSGLPGDGFVFCCFASPHKVTPAMFDVWMRLVARVPGSVLWLLSSNSTAEANLLREAESRLAGGAARVVFAPPLPNPQHLARFRCADLFLDTLPYNAHTLASDALWGGCPVVTCEGRAFPGRVAGSLLRAVGLPELVTSSLADYEALALALAQAPDRLRAIRDKLAANRLTTALFDSQRFTRNLEAAYETMWRMHSSGEALRGFAVAGTR